MDEAERAPLIQAYADGPARFRAAVRAAPAEMRKWRPGPDEFSVHEVVVHCADSEANSHGRIRYLVAEEDPTIVGYDPGHWARAFSYHDLPLGAALATVEAVRGNSVPLLRRFTDEDWAKSGTHTESGPYTAEGWLRIYAEHLREHTAQVQAVVAAWEAAGRPPSAGESTHG